MDALKSTYANHGVMLASAHKTITADVNDALVQLATGGNWVFDLKWDGVRCLALVNPPKSLTDGTTLNGVALVNRNGVDITYRYPDVCAALAEHFGTASVVLDGEVVALNNEGKPDFELLSRRDRVGSAERALTAAKKIRCTYVAFDLLVHDGVDYSGHAFAARRTVLDASMQGADGLLLLSPCSDQADVMWEFVRNNALEGLIAKQVSAPYHVGRANSWVKLKPTNTISALVTDWQIGNGKNSEVMGALFIGLIGPEGIHEVGKVGTGFTDEDRRIFAEKLAEVDPDPHGHYGIVVEVEYQSLTNDGKLRFPAYKGVRTDLVPAACTFAQLSTA